MVPGGPAAHSEREQSHSAQVTNTAPEVRAPMNPYRTLRSVVRVGPIETDRVERRLAHAASVADRSEWRAAWSLNRPTMASPCTPWPLGPGAAQRHRPLTHGDDAIGRATRAGDGRPRALSPSDVRCADLPGRTTHERRRLPPDGRSVPRHRLGTRTLKALRLLQPREASGFDAGWPLPTRPLGRRPTRDKQRQSYAIATAR